MTDQTTPTFFFPETADEYRRCVSEREELWLAREERLGRIFSALDERICVLGAKEGLSEVLRAYKISILSERLEWMVQDRERELKRRNEYPSHQEKELHEKEAYEVFYKGTVVPQVKQNAYVWIRWYRDVFYCLYGTREVVEKITNDLSKFSRSDLLACVRFEQARLKEVKDQEPEQVYPGFAGNAE